MHKAIIVVLTVAVVISMVVTVGLIMTALEQADKVTQAEKELSYHATVLLDDYLGLFTAMRDVCVHAQSQEQLDDVIMDVPRHTNEYLEFVVEYPLEWTIEQQVLRDEIGTISQEASDCFMVRAAQMIP